MLKKQIALVIAPLLSLGLLNLGAGFIMSFIPLAMNATGSSDYIVGFIMACYYIGSFFGSYLIERFIAKFKHIKSYLVCCVVLILALILQGVISQWWAWGILRIIFGFCIGGIFVVIESWLLAMSNAKSRGQILAIYMVALYATESVAQLFLKLDCLNGFFPFGFAAIFIALSLFPIGLTKKRVPSVEGQHKLQFGSLRYIPLIGLLGCMLAGVFLASYRAFLPLLLKDSMHFNNEIYAELLGLVILGGMLIQYPIGKLSDLFMRKKVIICLALFIVFSNLLLLVCFYYNFIVLFKMSLFFFGAGIFALYPVSISYACDLLEEKDIVAASAALSIAYSFGAIIGPWFIAPVFVQYLNYIGIFTLFSILSGLFVVFMLLRTDPIHRRHF